MHRVAEYIPGSTVSKFETRGKISAVVIAANTLDCEVIPKLLFSDSEIEVLSSSADVDFGLLRCERLRPNILIIDPSISDGAIDRCLELVTKRTIKHLLVLDDRVHEARLRSLLSFPNVSYLTRQIGSKSLRSGIQKITQTMQRTFDPEISERLKMVGKTWRLDSESSECSLQQLTGRELEVMKMLARGHSVKRCAAEMELAESTVDNHKSRLMKKLDIHKIVQLTHVAIREGLVVVT